MNNKKIQEAVRIFMVSLSALIYSLGMNSFVSSGNLFPGGYAGISRLLSMVLGRYVHINISFSVIYFLMNLITTIIVWKRIGHKFVLYSVLWYTEASLLTAVIHVPVLTSDLLLISVFGGVINGIAVGIALQHNASSGGTDFIAIDLSARLNMPVWNYIFALNACVLVIAGLCFGWNQALYSIIFQYVSKELVSSLHQRYKLKSVQIVTDHPEEISQAVFKICRHGITKLKCTGEYSHHEHDLLLININAFQRAEVVRTVLETDPKAFITVSSVDKIIGNYYQEPLQ
ncbi:MAG: YitT family protein [Solobacterium sp.]|nr:YitT family protein [Solobacterium sp.]